MTDTDSVIPKSHTRVIPKAKGVTDLEKLGREVGKPDLAAEIVDKLISEILNFGQPDCECHHCRNNRKTGSKKILNHGPYKTASELAENELNRVALPSDPDYVGIGMAVRGPPGGDLKGCEVVA